jgi:hypothetical protein
LPCSRTDVTTRTYSCTVPLEPATLTILRNMQTLSPCLTPSSSEQYRLFQWNREASLAWIVTTHSGKKPSPPPENPRKPWVARKTRQPNCQTWATTRSFSAGPIPRQEIVALPFFHTVCRQRTGQRKVRGAV